MKSIIEMAREAMASKEMQAQEAFGIFVSYCGRKLPRVPGMDTVIRLAIRLHFKGYSTEEAASREYVYRWHLALRSPIFGVPHEIGM